MFLPTTVSLRYNTMVEQSDQAPLLDWEEIPRPDPTKPDSPPLEKQDAATEKSSQAAGRTPASTAANNGWSSRGADSTVTCSSKKAGTAVGSGEESLGRPLAEPRGHRRDHPGYRGRDRKDVPFPVLALRDQWEEKDQIVAVFVVTFDTRSGKRDVLSLLSTHKIVRNLL